MELRHGCVYYCFYTFFFLIVIGNVSSSAICPPGFEYVDTNLNPVCIGFFNISETWEKAYNVCRHYSSYLYYYKSTDLEEIRNFQVKPNMCTLVSERSVAYTCGAIPIPWYSA